MDPETMALLNYYLAMQTQLDPTMASMLGQLISPNVNKYGELDQFGVDLEKTNLNQFQDITGSFDDPMVALLGGLGSFGPSPTGGGIVGGGGLDPITTETILETPATMRFQQLAQRAGQGGQVTPETYIANMLVNQQADPSVIVADLMAKMQDPNLDATTKNLFNSWLPQTDLKDMQGNPTGERAVDWTAAATKIEKAAEPYLAEQTTLGGQNIGTNNYGQFVQYSEQPSEMMQYLQKLGLPDPRAQYGVQFSVQNDPQLQELMMSIGTKGQALDEAKKAYQTYLKGKPIAQSMARRAEEMKGQREDKYKEAMRQYVSQTLPDWRRSQERGEPSVEGRRESYEAGPPGWIGGVADAIGGGIKGIPGQLNDTVSNFFGRPMGPRGSIRRPTNVDIFPESEPAAPPEAPTMGGPSLLEQMYARMQGTERRGARNRRILDVAGARQDIGQDALAMARAIAPSFGAMRAGRSPFKDAIMQRLQPILAAGGARR